MPRISAPESGPFDSAGLPGEALKGRQQDRNSNVAAR